MKTLLALAMLSVVTLAHLPGHACTAFMMSDGQRVLVGNNEDYNIPHTRVWFIPAENGHYGRVYFGYDNWSPQGGMNDLKYSRKTYTHPDPAFTISYPKHFKVTKPAKDEVLRVKCPLSSTPLFSVVVKDDG